MTKQQEILHGTALFFHGKGILLRGPSGSGKSDGALRLIEGGATLIADDVVVCHRREKGGAVLLSPLPQGRGLLEVRGIGIVSQQWIEEIPLFCVFQLGPLSEVPRLPEKQLVSILGTEFYCFNFHSFEVSFVPKVRYALDSASLL